MTTKSSTLSDSSSKIPITQSPNIDETKSSTLHGSNSNISLNQSSEKLTTKSSIFSDSSSSIPLIQSPSVTGTKSSILSDSSSNITLMQSKNSTDNSIKSSLNNTNTSVKLDTEQKPSTALNQESLVNKNKVSIQTEHFDNNDKEVNNTKSDQKEDVNITAQNCGKIQKNKIIGENEISKTKKK